MEALTVTCTVIASVMIGFLARKSTLDWVGTFFPTTESVRVPFYLADIFIGLGLVSTFACSLIYANREKMLMKHLTMTRSLNPYGYLLTMMVIRSLAFAVIQSFCWVFIALPLQGFSFSHIDIILINTIMFGFTWTGATFGVLLLVPPTYASHLLMIMNVCMMFLSGVFFYMSRIYGVFQVMHYFNPLFYILAASAGVVGINMLDSGCSETQHPGECASGLRILEMADVISMSSLVAQAFNLMFLIVFCVGVSFLLRPRELIRSSQKDRGDEKNEADDFEEDPVPEFDRRDAFKKSAMSKSKSRMSLVGARPAAIRSTDEWTAASMKYVMKSRRVSFLEQPMEEVETSSLDSNAEA